MVPTLFHGQPHPMRPWFIIQEAKNHLRMLNSPEGGFHQLPDDF